MRYVTKRYAFLILLAVFSINSAAQDPRSTEAGDAAVTSTFGAAIGTYIKERKELTAKMPHLSTEATAEQIATHKATLVTSIRRLRKAAKKGDIFTPEASAMFGRIVKANYSPAERAEIKAENAQADVKGVKLAVNSMYPEGREKIEMPPRLLLALPQLPDELSYHFVGKSLVLLDKESGLIIDLMLNALP